MNMATAKGYDLLTCPDHEHVLIGWELHPPGRAGDRAASCPLLCVTRASLIEHKCNERGGVNRILGGTAMSGDR